MGMAYFATSIYSGKCMLKLVNAKLHYVKCHWERDSDMIWKYHLTYYLITIVIRYLYNGKILAWVILTKWSKVFSQRDKLIYMHYMHWIWCSQITYVTILPKNVYPKSNPEKIIRQIQNM